MIRVRMHRSADSALADQILLAHTVYTRYTHPTNYLGISSWAHCGRQSINPFGACKEFALLNGDKFGIFRKIRQIFDKLTSCDNANAHTHPVGWEGGGWGEWCWSNKKYSRQSVICKWKPHQSTIKKTLGSAHVHTPFACIHIYILNKSTHTHTHK